jgi:outer membrane immunogenic protein
MLRRLFGVVGVSSLLVAAPLSVAGAADMNMPLKAPPAPPPPTYAWTGCYLGAGAGYGIYNADATEVDSASGAFVASEGTSGGRGWLGQGQAGCDYQFPLGNLGNFVMGAFGDYDGMDIHANHVGAGGMGDLKESWAWSAGGRIGYLVTPNFLAYESAGYTQTHFDQSNYVSVSTLLPNGESLAAQTYNGWFLGGGFEYALTFLPIHGLFLKTEYRYSQFDSQTVPNLVTTTGAAIGTSETIHPYVQSVTTELVFRFNWQ